MPRLLEAFLFFRRRLVEARGNRLSDGLSSPREKGADAFPRQSRGDGEPVLSGPESGGSAEGRGPFSALAGSPAPECREFRGHLIESVDDIAGHALRRLAEIDAPASPGLLVAVVHTQESTPDRRVAPVIARRRRAPGIRRRRPSAHASRSGEDGLRGLSRGPRRRAPLRCGLRLGRGLRRLTRPRRPPAATTAGRRRGSRRSGAPAPAVPERPADPGAAPVRAVEVPSVCRPPRRGT